MRRLLVSLNPVNLLYELGSGRALDNARREHEEVARTMAIVDALAGRIDAAERVGERVDQPIGTRAAA